MICVLQRVKSSSVTIKNQKYCEIGRGLNVLLAIEEDDNEKDLLWMAQKLINIRIFSNQSGKFDLSVKDINGELLVISQFTLTGDCRKGRRPDFSKAMKIQDAKEFYNKFIDNLKKIYIAQKIKTGVFQEEMEVDIKNDGPVTVIIKSKK